MTCVEPEICSCLFSGFIFVVFPCGFDVLPHKVLHAGLFFIVL
jgi:hypothetical protein